MRSIAIEAGHKIETKHTGIREELRKRISEGVYDSKLPPLRTLAKEFQVHVITISKAVNALTEEGLLLPVKGKGTLLAREMYQEITIGLVSIRKKEDFPASDRYDERVFKGIKEVFDRKGTNFFYQTTSNSQFRYRQLFRNCTLIDGILIFVPTLNRKKELLELKRAKVPFVTIGSSFKEERINYVDSDNVGDTYTAINYLIDKGHRKILFLTVEEAMTRKTEAPQRLEGYKLALADRGIEFDPDLVCNTEVEKVVKILKAKRKPTAIFASYPQQTLSQTVGIILDSGIRIPEDVVLMIHDDYKDRFSRFNVPYLVVRQPYTKIGRVAAEKLLGLITGKEKEPLKINLKSELTAGGASSEIHNKTV